MAPSNPEGKDTHQRPNNSKPEKHIPRAQRREKERKKDKAKTKIKNKYR